MNVNRNFKDNLMGKKKVIFIVCFIFAVALIAAILHMVSGGGKDSAKNIYYADKVSVITGNGSGTVNRFAGVVEAQDTLENLTFRRTESERDFRGKRAGSGAWDETI